MELKIMDVTLRESIYIYNNVLEQDICEQIVEGLSKSNLDYIEIGYISSKKSKHLAAYCPPSYIKALENKISPNSKSKLVIMLNIDDYNDDILNRLLNSNIAIVRLCIRFNRLETAIPIIKELNANGINVSANLVRCSELSKQQIIEFTNSVELAGAKYIYLADSNGAMLPNNIIDIYKSIKEISNLEIGFHPHNNLNLASMNALESFNQGASIIDCSIYGYGKGLVNLDLASFAATTQRLKLNKSINLKNLVEVYIIAYNEFIVNISNKLFYTKQHSLLSGYSNLNLDLLKNLRKNSEENDIRFLNTLLEYTL